MPVIINDKSNPGKIKYKCHRRDRMFNNKGSVYGIPITFFNNKRKLVESILIISTYGINFVDVKASEYEINFTVLYFINASGIRSLIFKT